MTALFFPLMKIGLFQAIQFEQVLISCFVTLAEFYFQELHFSFDKTFTVGGFLQLHIFVPYILSVL